MAPKVNPPKPDPLIPVGTRVMVKPIIGTVAKWCPQYHGKIGIQFSDGSAVIIDRNACIFLDDN